MRLITDAIRTAKMARLDREETSSLIRSFIADMTVEEEIVHLCTIVGMGTAAFMITKMFWEALNKV